MDTATLSASWIKLGHKKSIRKPTCYNCKLLYDMDWNISSLSNYIIKGGLFGGPIAMIRNPKQLQQMGPTLQTRARVMIFSCSGDLLSSFEWTKSSIVGMGWSAQEELVCVTTEGHVFIYDIWGNPIKQFALTKNINHGKNIQEENFRSDQIFTQVQILDDCIVGMTSDFRFYAITDLNKDPISQHFYDLDSSSQEIQSFTCLSPDFSPNGALQVIAAPEAMEQNDGTLRSTVLLISNDHCQDLQLKNAAISGNITHMTFNTDSTMLALYTDRGDVIVLHSDFTQKLLHFETKAAAQQLPDQLAWCGHSCVVVSWCLPARDQSLVLMIGVHDGSYRPLTFEGLVHLIPETEGVRIVSRFTHEFLYRVPESVTAIFEIGSMSPAARLFDAYNEYQMMSSVSILTVKEIKGDISDAVDQCIEAAAHEFDPEMQQALLRAAAYGKTFAEFFEADRFVDMCKTVRVLNEVRKKEIGIPITFEQLDFLTPRVLVDRLVNRHHHLLALRICQYLGLRPDKILVHWACQKVLRMDHLAEAELRRLIVGKIRRESNENHRISFAEIAATAYRVGRRDLAIELLEEEPSPGDQVPLLLQMKEFRTALKKSIESNDTDLVYLVILHLKSKLSLKQFERIMKRYPVAIHLFNNFALRRDEFEINALKQFYNQLEMRHQSAAVSIYQAFSVRSLDRRMEYLREAQKTMGSSSSSTTSLSSSKKSLFSSTSFSSGVNSVREMFPGIAEDQARLWEMQRKYQVSFESGGDDDHNNNNNNNNNRSSSSLFMGATLNDTLYRLIFIGQIKEATKLKNAFKVPDRRFWHIKIKALAKSQNWNELEKFAKSKRSPIGYAPFARACLLQEAEDEAYQYAQRITEPDQKVSVLLEMNQFQEAMQTAVDDRNVMLLEIIRQRTTNPQTRNTCDELIMQLS